MNAARVIYFSLSQIFFFFKRNINVQEIHLLVASHTPPTGDPAHNPGVCPGWESNLQAFDLNASTQSSEPHQPGLFELNLQSPLIRDAFSCPNRMSAQH